MHATAPAELAWHSYRDLQKLWAAITLLTSYDGNPCRFQVSRWECCVVRRVHAGVHAQPVGGSLLTVMVACAGGGSEPLPGLPGGGQQGPDSAAALPACKLADAPHCPHHDEPGTSGAEGA